MTVTEIVEISKSRSKVYIDQEFAFALYQGELRKYRVQEGCELAEEDYREILEKVLPRRARLRAMNLLQKRDYTTAQLQTKLRQGFYPEPVICDALEYVASFHYVDDLRYAVDYITCNGSRRSRRRLVSDLQGKGISRETIEKAFLQWEDQGGSQDEGAMIQELLRKKNYDPAHADEARRHRMYTFLLRRGFESHEIFRYISESY